jgi:hypothetical protein
MERSEISSLGNIVKCSSSSFASQFLFHTASLSLYVISKLSIISHKEKLSTKAVKSVKNQNSKIWN